MMPKMKGSNYELPQTIKAVFQHTPGVILDKAFDMFGNWQRDDIYLEGDQVYNMLAHILITDSGIWNICTKVDDPNPLYQEIPHELMAMVMLDPTELLREICHIPNEVQVPVLSIFKEGCWQCNYHDHFPTLFHRVPLDQARVLEVRRTPYGVNMYKRTNGNVKYLRMAHSSEVQQRFGEMFQLHINTF